MGLNILLTGATSGIGLGVCEYLLEKGFSVFGIGRNRQAITHLLDNKSFKFLEYDLYDFENYEKIFDLGVKLDGFVHCAGIEEVLPLSMHTYDKMKKIFDINVFSATELLRIFSKKKNSNDGASIVVIASVMSELSQPGLVGYSSSKSAILGIVKSAALELAKRKIRVNAISPGVVLTPMAEKLFDKLEESNINEILKMHPLGLGKVSDLAPLIEFLLAENSRWITGQNIKIDGGYSIH